MEALIFMWVVFCLPLAIIVGIGARRRAGRDGFGWFVISILISPILAGALLVALGRKQPNPNQMPVWVRWSIAGFFFLLILYWAGMFPALAQTQTTPSTTHELSVDELSAYYAQNPPPRWDAQRKRWICKGDRQANCTKGH
jgi:cytochrome bd-type quinol oxidase subunit 2